MSCVPPDLRGFMWSTSVASSPHCLQLGSLDKTIALFVFHSGLS
jgi:hypothetical protein